MPRVEHVVGPGEAGRTVKSIALKEMRVSRGLFSRLKFAGGIRLEGEPVRADKRVEAGQTLSVQWEELPGVALEPEQAAFSVVYEDDQFFVLDKPAPLPTLCSARQGGATLENAMFARLGCPKDFVFRPVNRLDKGTSGLLAVARNAHAQALLQRQLHTEDFVREYRAVCRGVFPEKAGVIDLPVGKTGDGIRRQVCPGGAPSVTRYWVEGEGEGTSLLRLRLETGRTHQIRVHLSALGHPILGDYLYGEADERLPGRFALHAYKLAFRHPFTGERIQAKSPLPPDMARLTAHFSRFFSGFFPVFPEK